MENDRVLHIHSMLTPRERQAIHDLSVEIIRVIVARNPHPTLVLTVLLNVIGNLIGTQFPAEERDEKIMLVEALIRPYVMAYVQGDKRI